MLSLLYFPIRVFELALLPTHRYPFALCLAKKYILELTAKNSHLLIRRVATQERIYIFYIDIV